MLEKNGRRLGGRPSEWFAIPYDVPVGDCCLEILEHGWIAANWADLEGAFDGLDVIVIDGIAAVIAAPP
jgi:hypothetical protein